MSSLADKLKSLGVKVGTSEITLPAPKVKTGVPIEEVVNGRYISTRQGDTFVYENHYPLDYRHGVVSLCPIAPLHTLAQWAKDMRLADLPLEAFAFLDTETSGLSGGTGTYAFMVGAGRFEAGTFRLLQFFMRDPGEEPALLEALADFLAPAQALVTYNGKAFDAPLLVTRYSLHSIPIPFKDYSHVDLLPLARCLWRDRLPSRSLKYIEENVLGAPRNSQEVPGYEIPYLYFDYLRSGDARPLAGVFYHNAMDIVALAALLKYVSHMLAEPLHESIQHGLDRIALAKLFEDLGKWDEAARLYERGLEDGLSEADFWPAVQRLSILQRRRGDLAEAVKLWEKAAAQGHVYAHVELAKHYEHRVRDYATARQWTQKAMELARDSSLPVYMQKHWVEELEHRRKRLEKRRSGER